MKHSEYFGGRVQSLGMNEREGYATVGVIEAGDYTFSTDGEERITIVAGEMRTRLSGQEWKAQAEGATLVVPAKSSFDIEARADVAYICRYR